MSNLDRREFLGSVAAGVATVSTVAAAKKSRADPSGLAAPAFRPLPLGSIRPEGTGRPRVRAMTLSMSRSK